MKVLTAWADRYHAGDMGKFESPIDPSGTGQQGWKLYPVGMIVKMDHGHGLADMPQQSKRQMMKIPRSEKIEGPGTLLQIANLRDPF
jgi:hypothetical protein